MTLTSTQEITFEPSDTIASDYEQMDVSISEDGTWIAMGMPIHRLDEDGLNLLSEAGACYLFKKVDGIYTQKQKIVDASRLANNQFGSKVWMSSYGRRLFVASKQDSNSILNGGSVTVYDLDETNDIWALNSKIEIAVPIEEARFGWAIASDYYGQLLVVGASFEPNGGIARGAGYLFKDNGTAFDQINKFSYSKGLNESRLGASIAISGDGNVIFVGMTLSNLSGSIGVFKKNDAGIFPSIETSIVKDVNGLENDYFAVAFDPGEELIPIRLLVDNITISIAAETPTVFTVWGLGSASYDSISFNTVGIDSILTEMQFNGDGTKVFTLGAFLDRIYQFSLPTPYVLTGMSYDSVSFDISGQTTAPLGMFFKPDGSKVYVMSSIFPSTIFQYSLPTPYILTGMSYDGVFLNINSQDSQGWAVFLKDDGARLFMLGETTSSMYQYTLPTPWVLTGGSYDSVSFDVSGQDAFSVGMFFRPGGTRAYTIGRNSSKAYQYSLPTPWILTGISYDSISLDVSDEDNIPGGIVFKPSGENIYIVGTDTETLFQYSS